MTSSQLDTTKQLESPQDSSKTSKLRRMITFQANCKNSLRQQAYGLLLFLAIAHMVSLDYYFTNRNGHDAMLTSARKSMIETTGSRGVGLLAEARVVGRMARMWYIKKQIKKLNKKLRGTTITLPIVTRIPIYDHAYYPAPQITQITEPLENSLYYQPGAAAQSYQAQPQQQQQYYVPSSSPGTNNQQQQQQQTYQSTGVQGSGTQQTTSAPMTTAASQAQPQSQQQQQQVTSTSSVGNQVQAGSTSGQLAAPAADLSMAVSSSQPQYQYAPMMMQQQASNMHPHMMGYRRPFVPPNMHQQQQHYHQQQQYPRPRFPAPSYRHQQHQYINAYQPSPPTQVDHAEGIYGQYGNAYGRYDGGYHMVF